MRSLLVVIYFFSVSLLSSAQFAVEKKITDPDTEIDGQRMHIRVIDAKSNDLTQADVRIEGIIRKPLMLESVADTTLNIKTYRLFNVSCVKEGYMYYAHKFWPDEKSIHEENIILKPLKLGLKTDVRDITFIGDETGIYSKSADALEELIEFLELHPTMKLAIIGHVNGPDNQKNTNFYRKASVKRAQSVVDYLVEHGIAKERLEARGEGNSQMLYPKPSTDWQSEANRRIEIEIIAL